jgi:hypothetical protein
MAGRPVLRKLAAAIAALGDPGTDPEGEGYIWDRVVSGETLDAIASTFEVSKGTLLAWLRLGGKDGPRWRAYQEARELSAFVKEEEGAQTLQQLADEKHDITNPLTSQRVTLATAIAAHKRWQAEKRNRAEFGTQASTQVTLNIAEMHLEALKAVGGPVALPAKVIEADYQIEGGDSHGAVHSPVHTVMPAPQEVEDAGIMELLK